MVVSAEREALVSRGRASGDGRQSSPADHRGQVAGCCSCDGGGGAAPPQAAVLEDRVQRVNRQLLGPRKDPETGEWSRKHRAGTCGLPHGERVEMGYVTVPDGLDAGQLGGVVVCAAGNQGSGRPRPS